MLDVQSALQDSRIPYQELAIVLSLAVGMFETFVSSRQKHFLSPVLSPAIPAALLPYLAPGAQDTYHKSQRYASDKLSLASALGTLDQAETLLLLTSFLASTWTAVGLGATPPTHSYLGSGWTLLKGFWDLAGELAARGGIPLGGLAHSLVLVAILKTLGAVLSMPKAYYSTFVVEQRHGFNRTTKQTFLADQAKSYVLGIVLELPLIGAILWLIEWMGPSGMVTVVLSVMALILVFSLAMIPLYPLVILPLFSTLTPLDASSPVFETVQKLADRLGFPLKKIVVIDGSKRSSHSNAFFTGIPFFSKTIVIFDTLLEKASTEEVEAILAHEMGHWSGNHVLVLLATSMFQVGLSLSVFLLFLNNEALLKAFGFNQSSPTIISLFLAATLFVPISAVMSLVTNTVTRRLEYDADAFAVKLGTAYATALKAALVKIHEQNLAIYATDFLYSMYHNNHPTLVERLERLDEGIESIAEKKQE